jgi:hypothetical protein
MVPPTSTFAKSQLTKVAGWTFEDENFSIGSRGWEGRKEVQLGAALSLSSGCFYRMQGLSR